MNAMQPSPRTMAEQIAQVVTGFQQQTTGVEPTSVSVVLSQDTLVVTIHGALSPAERTLSRSPEGAAQVEGFHRQLFLSASESLREEIKRITGMDVREARAEVEPASGTLVHVFTSGTMVQVFLLSGNLPSGSFQTGDKTRVENRGS